MQQTQAVFGELAHYGSEPFKCTSAYSIHCYKMFFVFGLHLLPWTPSSRGVYSNTLSMHV